MKNANHSPYIPALDGIRAVSILLVFVGHQGLEHWIPGSLGVTIFFFLSGFLITNLLFAECRQTGSINLSNFYIRRLLRLYPALLCMLLVFTVYLLVQQEPIDVTEMLAALFYFENYYVAFADTGNSHFWILWSLAVEEHFYLFFPFLFLALVQRFRALVAVTLGLILASLLLRIYTVWSMGVGPLSSLSTGYLTHNRFDSILTGCLASMAMQTGFGLRLLQVAARRSVYALALSTLLFTIVYRDDFFRQTFRYTLQGAALFMLVVPVVYSQRYAGLNKLLSLRPLVFIGKLSYAVYLFHWVSLAVFRDLGFVIGTPQWIAGNTVLTALLSLVSYYGIERRFLLLRKRLGSAASQPGLNNRQAPVKVVINERVRSSWK